MYVLNSCNSIITNNTMKQNKTDTVEIKQMAFFPATITVNKGDTIVFINHDLVDHDVTEENKKLWTSSPLHPGQAWSKVFTEPANYFCSLHVVMKGKIVVQ
ncbi:MAG: cupredoxin domain-containing protein [Bacteroidetes bacterium]|nr:cupredoxin domain-containing protein [Bacteroidota bacterium]